MRHLKRQVKFKKSLGHRKAIYINVAKSIFTHKRIVTTLGKAKLVQPFVERIITHAKKTGLNAYRLVEAELSDQRLVKRVVEKIAPNYKDKKGGYTRIIKMEPRVGDNAPMAVFELVGDYILKEPLPEKKKKSETKPTTVEAEKSEKKVVKKVSVEKK